MLKKDKADFKKELEAIVPEVKLGDKGTIHPSAKSYVVNIFNWYLCILSRNSLL